MKKKLFKLSLFVSLLMVLFIVIFVVNNLFDAPAPDGVFTIDDLSPASLEPDNAYYQIMAFSYPSDLDITAADVINDIRKIAEPEMLSLTTEESYKIYKKHDGLSRKLEVKSKDIFKQIDLNDFEKIANEKNKIEILIKSNQILMKRYLLLLKTDKVEDFSLPTLVYPTPVWYPIIRISKLYISENVITAVEGKWMEGVTDIFKQFNFFRRFSENSRQSINKAICHLLMEISLKSLVFIMNQEDCPDDVFSLVLDGLPRLKESEIGLQNNMIFEFLTGVQLIDEVLRGESSPFDQIGAISGFFPSKVDMLNFLSKFKIFLNRNRTVQLFHDGIKKGLEFENKPPFQWEKDLVFYNPKVQTGGLFWWFSNPVGKAIYGFGNNSFKQYIYLKYQTQTIFDLTRICAEFHQKFTTEKPLSEIFKDLDNYKVIDPFSGKPYVVNEEKQILYSIGTNRIDDGGLGTRNKRGEFPDLVLSCRFNEKTVNK